MTTMTDLKLNHREQAQILESTARLLVDALHEASPLAIKVAAGELQSLGDDMAQPMGKRPTYRKLALLLRREAKK